jgi:hypothetical protein
MRKLLPELGALLFLCASTALLFAPLTRAALTSEQRFLEWDVPEQYWPDLVSLCGALHDGELPYWNPYDRGGYPSYADPQAGTYHPLNLALCALGGRSPSLALAELRVVLGFFFAGLFGLLWLRRLQLPLGAALFGAVVIQAAPFMRHNWELNLTTALAYLPLMLWAADRAAVERRLRDGAVLGFAAALCAWVGSPPALWFAGTFTAAYFLFRWLAESWRGGLRVLLRGLAVAAVAAVFAAGFTLVVLIPGALLAQHSVQAGRDFASISAGGLEVSQLVALLLPQDGNHLYLGLVVLALIPFAFLQKSKSFIRRSSSSSEAKADKPKSKSGKPNSMLAAFFLSAAVFAVLMTMGAHGPLFRLAFDWIPGVGVFRLPHRYEAWLGPAMGALAALGLSWFSSERLTAALRSRRRRARLVAGALILAGAGLMTAEPSLFGVALLPVVAGFVLVAASSHRPSTNRLLLGMVLASLFLLDVTQRMPENRHTREGPHPDSFQSAAAILENAPGTDAEYRYFDEFGISCRSGTRLGRRDFRGYQDPLLLKAYERVAGSLREHPRLLEQLNVRYVLTGPHFIHGWSRHYLPRPEELLAIPGAIDRGEGVVELPAPLPFAYWVPRSQVTQVADRPSALRHLIEVAPAPVAILDGAVTKTRRSERATSPIDTHPKESPPNNDSPLVSARDVEVERDRVAFRVDAPRAGMVVVNEVWYPGWRATVDGDEVPIYRTNALVRGVFVDAGEHRVVMTFRPTDGIALRWTLLATWLAFLIVMSLGLPPNSNRRPSGAAPRACRASPDSSGSHVP